MLAYIKEHAKFWINMFSSLPESDDRRINTEAQTWLNSQNNTKLVCFRQT